jgi:hypothetical protein
VPANTSEFAPDASSAVADTAARAPITPSTVSNTGALASAASGTVTDSNAPAPVTPGASADTSAHALGTSSTSAGAIDANATTAGTSADAGDGTGTAGAPRTVGVSGSPAYKIALKQCPDCGRAWQFTGGRDIEVGPAVIELAACDAVRLGSLDAVVPERATTTVTPRKREQVLARDGYCCTVPGCRRNIGLDLHHVEYQSRGGGHRLSNLTTLCDLHHRAVHFEKLAIRGAAPDRLTFEFRTPRDRQNITDDDEPWRATTESGSEGRAESAGRHCVLDDASHGDRGANR